MIFTRNQKVFHLSLKLYEDNEHKNCCKSFIDLCLKYKINENKKKE